MFGKLISEQTESQIAGAVAIATYAKAIESMTAAMSHAANTPEGGELVPNLRATVDDLHSRIRSAIGAERGTCCSA